MDRCRLQLHRRPWQGNSTLGANHSDAAAAATAAVAVATATVPTATVAALIDAPIAFQGATPDRDQGTMAAATSSPVSFAPTAAATIHRPEQQWRRPSTPEMFATTSDCHCNCNCNCKCHFHEHNKKNNEDHPSRDFVAVVSPVSIAPERTPPRQQPFQRGLGRCRRILSFGPHRDRDRNHDRDRDRDHDHDHDDHHHDHRNGDFDWIGNDERLSRANRTGIKSRNFGSDGLPYLDTGQLSILPKDRDDSDQIMLEDLKAEIGAIVDQVMNDTTAIATTTTTTTAAAAAAIEQSKAGRHLIQTELNGIGDNNSTTTSNNPMAEKRSFLLNCAVQRHECHPNNNNNNNNNKIYRESLGEESDAVLDRLWDATTVVVDRTDAIAGNTPAGIYKIPHTGMIEKRRLNCAVHRLECHSNTNNHQKRENLAAEIDAVLGRLGNKTTVADRTKDDGHLGRAGLDAVVDKTSTGKISNSEPGMIEEPALYGCAEQRQECHPSNNRNKEERENLVAEIDAFLDQLRNTTTIKDQNTDGRHLFQTKLDAITNNNIVGINNNSNNNTHRSMIKQHKLHYFFGMQREDCNFQNKNKVDFIQAEMDALMNQLLNATTIVEQTTETASCLVKMPTPDGKTKTAPTPSRLGASSHRAKPQQTEPRASSSRVLFTKKIWDGDAQQWKPASPTHEEAIPRFHRIPLSRGGVVHVFPNLIPPVDVNRIKKELLESKLWRKYSIQAGDEPRLHFLAHDDATEDFENGNQPGYRYANVTMKARPLSSVPNLQELSRELAKFRNVPGGKWNIGVHPVLYRDNRDSMGDHADDDQGETRILCVLLDSPPTPRKVVIKVFDRLTGGKGNKNRVYQNGDEVIELRLRPGDAYEMDGIMQQFYSHRVPKDKDYKNSAIEKIRRLCVVLRTGQQKYFERDTGEACNDLSPRKRISYRFGCIPELEKGCSYTRRELLKLNAHQHIQRGISGNMQSGADAIIISGKRNGDDNLDNLWYVAEWRIGASALYKSYSKLSPIRVFRSLEYILKNIALVETKQSTACDPRNSSTATMSKLYRYDGLYTIVKMRPPTDPRGTFEFFLTREGTQLSRTFSKMGGDRFRFGQKDSTKRKSCSGPSTTVPTGSSKRFRSIPPESNMNTVVPNAIPWKPSWAEDYGPNDLSCCATLLLLGKEICTIHALVSLLRNRLGKQTMLVGIGDGSPNDTRGMIRAFTTDEHHPYSADPPIFQNRSSDPALSVAAAIPSQAHQKRARVTASPPTNPPQLPPWPPNRLRRDGGRLCIRMYQPRKIRNRPVSGQKTRTKAAKPIAKRVLMSSMPIRIPIFEDRKVTRRMAQAGARNTRSMTKRLDERWRLPQQKVWLAHCHRRSK